MQPVVFTILVVLIVLTLLPPCARLLPFWVTHPIGFPLILSVSGIWLSGVCAGWLRVEGALLHEGR